MNVYQLRAPAEPDYPAIDWDLSTNSAAAAQLLEIDSALREGADPFSLQGPTFELEGNADVVDLCPGLAVSQRARRALESLAVAGLQFLPLSNRGLTFWLLFTRRTVDCLDLAKSEISWFSGNPPRVMQIRRHAFEPHSLAEVDVFALPQESDGMFAWSAPIYFTEAAKSRFLAFDLYKAHFHRVWGDA